MDVDDVYLYRMRSNPDDGRPIVRRKLDRRPPIAIIRTLPSFAGKRRRGSHSSNSESPTKRRRSRSPSISESRPVYFGDRRTCSVNGYDELSRKEREDLQQKERTNDHRMQQNLEKDRSVQIEKLRDTIRPWVQQQFANRTPMEILQLIDSTKMEQYSKGEMSIRQMYRKILMIHHPDRSGDKCDRDKIVSEEIYKTVVDLKDSLNI